jgi:hypothetical protein
VVVAYLIYLSVTLVEDDKTLSNVTYSLKVLKYAHRIFNSNTWNEPYERRLRGVTCGGTSELTGKETIFDIYIHSKRKISVMYIVAYM